MDWTPPDPAGRVDKSNASLELPGTRFWSYGHAQCDIDERDLSMVCLSSFALQRLGLYSGANRCSSLNTRLDDSKVDGGNRALFRETGLGMAKAPDRFVA